jgi:hypothetical protein
MPQINPDPTPPYASPFSRYKVRSFILYPPLSQSGIIAFWSSPPLSSFSDNVTEHLGFQDELPFLVLLTLLESLVVLPPDVLAALTARDVAHEVSSRRHIPLAGFAFDYIDHHVE